MKKRILSILTVLALCLGLLPTTVFAVDGDKAIMLGTNGISGYDDSTNSYDYIYFGNWTAPDIYTTNGPIKWRVLDDQTNTGGDGLFLLSDVLFGKGNRYGGGVCFNQDRSSNVWQDSAAQKWCQDFYGSSFSTGEQGAVLATTKTDAAYKATSVKPPIDFLGSELKGDTVFFLSAEEVESSAYGFINNAARLAYFGNTGNWGAWWLRSPDKLTPTVAGTITRSPTSTAGSLSGNFVDNDYSYTARPAFNLDLDAVLFTSAAVGGKSATGMESGLTAVDAYDGSEWKLTLLDDCRDFDVTETDISGDPGDTITLHYTGATTGDNEYISVILAAESGVQYYGRIAKATTAEGEISLTIPDTLAEGTYTLNVFNEQCNGDYKTDYASAFETFTLTVDITAPTLSNGSATRDSETSATVKFTSDEAGSYYYIAQDTEITLTNTEIATQGTKQACKAGENEIELDNIAANAWYVAVVAQDAVGNISDVLKMEIPAYIEPVYDISADTQSLDFGTVTEGYEAPAEQTVTITNAGNQPQTLTQPASTRSFEVGTLSKAKLPVGETVTFTVRPKAGLPVGSYSENIVVSGLGNTTVSVTANFTVKQFSSGGATTTYPVQVEENSQNGGVQVSPKNAVPGTLVTVTPQPAPGYELATLSVLDQYGNEVDVNPLGNGNYSFKMPRSGVKVEATFYCTGSELCPTHHLSDVLVKAWYHDAVDYVVEHGIMTGTSATTFEPNTTLSRAMVAQILYNLEGQPTVTGESTFTDVSGHWAIDAITWAQKTGVVTGYENNTFRPNQAVTREELAQVLYNYAQYKKINRDLSLTDESGTAITSTGLIQTDAAINPGNSGGALLNMAGELIGINEAKTSSSGSGGSVDNIGFAIPIDKAEDSLKELMNLPTREKVDPSEASYLGIEGETITQDITQLYGIPTGVGVVAVEQGSPAEKAGIQQGDVITQFDGRAVANQQQLSDTLQYYKAGETVDVTLQRADNGKYAGQTVSVTLGSAKDMPQESGASSTAESSDT